MTVSRELESSFRRLADEQSKIDRSKAAIWSALSVIAIMATIVATAAVVPVVIWIYTTLIP